MQHQITVTRSALQITSEPNGPVGNFTVSYTQSYTASHSVNVDPFNAIFKLHQRPTDPSNPASLPTPDFHGVCTPADLAALPVNAVLPGGTEHHPPGCWEGGFSGVTIGP